MVDVIVHRQPAPIVPRQPVKSVTLTLTPAEFNHITNAVGHSPAIELGCALWGAFKRIKREEDI